MRKKCSLCGGSGYIDKSPEGADSNWVLCVCKKRRKIVPIDLVKTKFNPHQGKGYDGY